MRRRTNIEKVMALRGTDMAQVSEAVFFLLISNFLIYLVPLRRWHQWIGRQSEQHKETTLSPEQPGRIRQLKENVRRANKLLFNTSKCFAMSLALKKMMSRRKLPAALYLGVKKDETKNLAAHAWVKSGENIIYGGKNATEHFKQLISFA
ncbi:MAG: lasso peptide biosynthesis B2 protein [Bacteroidota bacterium]